MPKTELKIIVVVSSNWYFVNLFDNQWKWWIFSCWRVKNTAFRVCSRLTLCKKDTLIVIFINL